MAALTMRLRGRTMKNGLWGVVILTLALPLIASCQDQPSSASATTQDGLREQRIREQMAEQRREAETQRMMRAPMPMR